MMELFASRAENHRGWFVFNADGSPYGWGRFGSKKAAEAYIAGQIIKLQRDAAENAAREEYEAAFRAAAREERAARRLACAAARAARAADAARQLCLF